MKKKHNSFIKININITVHLSKDIIEVFLTAIIILTNLYIN